MEVGEEDHLSITGPFALRPQKQGGVLGMGTGGEGDRRDRGPPPEQWKC